MATGRPVRQDGGRDSLTEKPRSCFSHARHLRTKPNFFLPVSIGQKNLFFEQLLLRYHNSDPGGNKISPPCCRPPHHRNADVYPPPPLSGAFCPRPVVVNACVRRKEDGRSATTQQYGSTAVQTAVRQQHRAFRLRLHTTAETNLNLMYM